MEPLAIVKAGMDKLLKLLVAMSRGGSTVVTVTVGRRFCANLDLDNLDYEVSRPEF